MVVIVLVTGGSLYCAYAPIASPPSDACYDVLALRVPTRNMLLLAPARDAVSPRGLMLCIYLHRNHDRGCWSFGGYADVCGVTRA